MNTRHSRSARVCISLMVLVSASFLSAGSCGGDPTAPECGDGCVWIDRPSDGASDALGAQVEFRGGARGPKSEVPAHFLKWTSDLQGELGTGAEFTRDDLVLGDHTITLTARDDAGMTVEESVNITIAPPQHDCSKFTMEVSPSTQSCRPGDLDYVGVLISRIGEFTGDVRLSLETGQGAFSDWSFQPTTTSQNSSFQYTLKSDAQLCDSDIAITIRGEDADPSSDASCSAVFHITN